MKEMRIWNVIKADLFEDHALTTLSKTGTN